ncbi:hypothetical protein F2Q69_00059677 [Brassica cretica]|uniref:Uncharacterized protein n=1 Tax=Brassica cretica TaxID=69181 RepID=A0A8S9RCC7_BRACR|nr:hypothetical protein F2Q69_00059677 [Brassica cretica]
MIACHILCDECTYKFADKEGNVLYCKLPQPQRTNFSTIENIRLLPDRSSFAPIREHRPLIKTWMILVLLESFQVWSRLRNQRKKREERSKNWSLTPRNNRAEQSEGNDMVFFIRLRELHRSIKFLVEFGDETLPPWWGLVGVGRNFDGEAGIVCIKGDASAHTSDACAAPVAILGLIYPESGMEAGVGAGASTCGLSGHRGPARNREITYALESTGVALSQQAFL